MRILSRFKGGVASPLEGLEFSYHLPGEDMKRVELRDTAEVGRALRASSVGQLPSIGEGSALYRRKGDGLTEVDVKEAGRILAQVTRDERELSSDLADASVVFRKMSSKGELSSRDLRDASVLEAASDGAATSLLSSNPRVRLVLKFMMFGYPRSPDVIPFVEDRDLVAFAVSNFNNPGELGDQMKKTIVACIESEEQAAYQEGVGEFTDSVSDIFKFKNNRGFRGKRLPELAVEQDVSDRDRESAKSSPEDSAERQNRQKLEEAREALKSVNKEMWEMIEDLDSTSRDLSRQVGRMAKEGRRRVAHLERRRDAGDFKPDETQVQEELRKRWDKVHGTEEAGDFGKVGEDPSSTDLLAAETALEQKKTGDEIAAGSDQPKRDAPSSVGQEGASESDNLAPSLRARLAAEAAKTTPKIGQVMVNEALTSAIGFRRGQISEFNKDLTIASSGIEREREGGDADSLFRYEERRDRDVMELNTRNEEMNALIAIQERLRDPKVMVEYVGNQMRTQDDWNAIVQAEADRIRLKNINPYLASLKSRRERLSEAGDFNYVTLDSYIDEYDMDVLTIERRLRKAGVQPGKPPGIDATVSSEVSVEESIRQFRDDTD